MAPRFQDSRHMKVVRLSALRTGRQVGKEAVSFPTVGNYSLHTLTKDNGSRLIQFAISRNMVIGTTFHPHKDFHKSTWRSPDGVTSSQIDHLLIDF